MEYNKKSELEISIKYGKKELEDMIKEGREHNCNVVLIEANKEKGFNYSYYIYIPKILDSQSMLLMDCLNEYDTKIIEDGYIENLDAMEEVYKLFNNNEINRSYIQLEGKQEDRLQTLNRMYMRFFRGINTLSRMIGITNFNAPCIVPLIPGSPSDEFGKTESQLDKDVIKKIAPQIKAMIEDSKKIIEERTGIAINDKIIPLGHSKSATFANNFSSYYPEMCAAGILGGGSFGTLPIDKIVLQIVDDIEITDNEQFSLINGFVTKRITKLDFDRIMQEYNNTKRDYQDEISINENGTYNLPMNFPLGISDIEYYRDLSEYTGGKGEYRQILMSMSKMIFVGEQEDVEKGHYAYNDCITREGIEVKIGDDINVLKDKGILVEEIEVASMHNRVLEYIAASNTLFGKSSNERLNSYMQLYKVLDMPVQSIIYEDVGHRDIYRSKPLKKDILEYYRGTVLGEITQLDKSSRAKQISPIHQLARRCEAAGYDIDKELLQKLFEVYLAQKKDENLDRIFDEMSPEKIHEEIKNLSKNIIIKKGKSGLDDCMQDDGVRTFSEQDATKTLKNAVLNQDKVLDINEHYE